MSAWEVCAQSRGFERDQGLRNDGRRRRKGDDVCNGTGRRSAAEGAVLEMRVRSRVVMLMMPGHLHRVRRGTHFQQKRRTACRHEANGHVGTKQEDHQQQAGE